MKSDKKVYIYKMPILTVVFIVPIVVYPYLFELNDVYYYNWLSNTTHIDYFSYYSTILLLSCSIFLLGFFFLRLFENDVPRDIVLISILLYLLFAIFSTLQSKYIAISIFGFNDRNEGLLILFCYALIFLGAYTVSLTVVSINRLVGTIFIMSTIVGLLGVFQFFGFDYFDSTFFNNLISYGGFTKSIPEVTTEKISRTVYSTLYNPNYVGSFAALIFPLSFGFYYYSKGKKGIFSGIFSCIIFALLVGSRSRAGVVGVVVAMLIFFVFNIHNIFYKKKKFVILIVYASIFIYMDFVSGGNLINKFMTLSPQVERERSIERYARIEDIEIKNDRVTIINDQNDIIIESIEKDITVRNIDEVELSIQNIDNIYYIMNEGFEVFSFVLEETESGKFVLLKIRDTKINLVFNEKGAYLVGTHDRIYNRIHKAPYYGFEGRERFGSSRGYIWSRALPMIKSNLFYGNGPDTFAAMFPQEDFIGKLNGFGRVNIIVDKPHNYYIQVAHDTGLLSLISLCCLFVTYFFRSFKFFFYRKKDDYWSNIGVSIMVGILGYLIAAFFNDSVVYVAPVFWALLGTGYAINYKLRNEVKVSTTLP